MNQPQLRHSVRMMGKAVLRTT